QWVSNLKWDWAISRQRYYGVPIPVWYSKKTGEIIFPDESQLPVDPHAELPLNMPAGHTADDIIADSDVLDTWATSSLTPQINAGCGQNADLHDRVYPMDLRPQAHDIIRTWALYTIVMSELHEQSAPWSNIMISGHVLAQKGEKLSKSKSAGVKGPGSPEELIAKYSADAVRYWACGASLGKDVVFDENEILKGKKLITKLWNAAKFSIGNLEDFDPAKDMVAESDMEPTDQWLLLRIREVADLMNSAFEKYEVGSGRQEFENFFWKDFCDNYLEMVKTRLRSPELIEGGEKKKRSAQTALYIGLKAVLQFIAPYMPHVSDGIYQHYYKNYESESSLHRTKYPQGMEGIDSSEHEPLRFGMNNFITLIGNIRRIRTTERIAFSTEPESLEIHGPTNILTSLKPFIDDIKGFSKAKNIQFIEGESFDVKIIQ
ncbi:MAG: class I tRNA ligase family protein, partial [Candidatus Gracilibacteria bacterium]